MCNWMDAVRVRLFLFFRQGFSPCIKSGDACMIVARLLTDRLSSKGTCKHIDFCRILNYKNTSIQLEILVALKCRGLYKMDY